MSKCLISNLYLGFPDHFNHVFSGEGFSSGGDSYCFCSNCVQKHYNYISFKVKFEADRAHHDAFIMTFFIVCSNSSIVPLLLIIVSYGIFEIYDSLS